MDIKRFKKANLHNLQKQLAMAICMLLATGATVDASTREVARQALDLIHNNQLSQNMSHKLKSADATFTYAEDFQQKNHYEIAERYYLLTIQKARVILLKIGKISESEAITFYQESDKPRVEASTPDTHQPTIETHEIESPILTNATEAASIPLLAPTATADSPISLPLQPQTQKTVEGISTANDYVTSDKLVGNVDTYMVKKHDTLRLVAAKLGVSRQLLSKMNNIDPKAPLKIGQQLKYNNRKIIPQRMANGIVINIPDRTLYFFRQGKLAISLPVALGIASKTKKYDWTTPTGKFQIIGKQKDPTWHVPPSIQSEMENTGKEIIATIPPGPANPLGKYAIKTSIPNILIHSTISPGSIYSFSSHGCIRLYPEHMVDFFKEIKISTPGEIIYRPVKLAVTESGRVFLEVHQDAYGKSPSLAVEARLQIKKRHLSDRVDWDKVEAVIKQKSGVAEDITL